MKPLLRICLSILVGFGIMAGTPSSGAAQITVEMLLGEYRHDPVQNNWHIGTITVQGTVMRWTNKAGVSWTLTLDSANQRLLTGTENPYYGQGQREFTLIVSNGQVRGFKFGGGTYVRQVTATQPSIAAPSPIALETLPGTYRHEPVQNDWHIGSITAQGSGFRWTNKAGVSWSLTPDLANNRLLTGTENPYYQQGLREFTLIVNNGQVTGFKFSGSNYMRESTAAQPAGPSAGAAVTQPATPAPSPTQPTAHPPTPTQPAAIAPMPAPYATPIPTAVFSAQTLQNSIEPTTPGTTVDLLTIEKIKCVSPAGGIAMGVSATFGGLHALVNSMLPAGECSSTFGTAGAGVVVTAASLPVAAAATGIVATDKAINYLNKKFSGTDDLIVQVNGKQIIPGNGIGSGKNFPMTAGQEISPNISVSFQGQARIDLIEYDTVGDNDDLGGIRVIGGEDYRVKDRIVLAPSAADGSVYYVTYSVKKGAGTEAAVTQWVLCGTNQCIACGKPDCAGQDYSQLDRDGDLGDLKQCPAGYTTVRFEKYPQVWPFDDVYCRVCMLDTHLLNMVPGAYQTAVVKNNWHVGTIAQHGSAYRWTNKAGASWGLTPDLAKLQLTAGPDNPYNKTGPREFKLIVSGGRLTGFKFGGDTFQRTISIEDIPGTYRHDPVQNGWHTGTIVRTGDKLQWVNKAGVKWSLTPDLANKKLVTGTDNPYYKDGIREFTLNVVGGRITGFKFGTATYNRQ
jgi:hypothetical protein